MIVRKTSVFPAPREEVLSRLQRLETLQYIAAPYATFTPVSETTDFRWEAGASSEYRFKLFGTYCHPDWRATVHRVAKRWTRLKQLST